VSPTRLSGEKLIAEALLEWLGGGGYISDSAFGVHPTSGETYICVELPNGVRVDARSYLGPLECACDVARAVVAEWAGAEGVGA
jgi:hypothetical protein